MARREKPLDPDAGPVQAFAVALREARREAGQPTYRALAQKAGYSASTLSEAAAGERLPSLPVALAYVAACGAASDGWEDRWRAAAVAGAVSAPVDDATEAPYRGLARYETGDAAVFFGRDQLTGALLELVREHRFTALSGPSGSGKTSLLRAGLLPALQHENTLELRPAALRILTPGPRPVHIHATALSAREDTAGDTVIVVDQFEELFTLCTDVSERTEFLRRLLAAREPDSRLRVVIAVRADFLGRCADHSELAAALRGTLLLVGPMSRDELRQTITGPAQAAGLMVERSLTARLLAEAEGQPGALPLLSHALLETWRRRQGRTLTEVAYESTGGLHGSIARTAEDCYAGLTSDQTGLARTILLRLITPGDGTPDTRCPTPHAQLGLGAPADTAAVLERLTRARLITVDDGVVDLAHEALITAWPRLDGWLDTDRDRLRIHRRLTDAAIAWHDLHRDPGALYRGALLTAAEDAFPPADRPCELTDLERDFLTAGTTARHREQRIAVRMARRQRRFVVVLSALLAVVVVAGLLAWQQHRRSEEEGRRSTLLEQSALSRKLAAKATALLRTDAELGSLLALHAYRAYPTTDAVMSLRAAAALRHQHRLTKHRDGYFEVAYGRDADTLVTLDSQGVRLWHERSGESRVVVKSRAAGRIRLSPDGRTLAVEERSGLQLWDVATRSIRTTLDAGKGVVDVAFSPDGRTVAIAGYESPTRLWDAATGDLRATLTDENEIWSLAFSPDGRVLATGSDKGIRLWDTTTAKARAVTLADDTKFGLYLAFSPDNSRVLAAMGINDADHVQLWDVTTGRTRARLDADDSAYMAFSPDGRILAVSNDDGQIFLWDTATGRPRTVLTDRGSVYALMFSPDGRSLAVGTDTAVRLWDTDLPTEPGDAIRTICRAVRRDLTSEQYSTYLPGQPHHRACASG
ncbi:helix-turn-helix domain-containing protein [Streptomyces sp. NPDC059786]|uniref:nSTAND1 domain-containing NTPase n=1 Tax=Streptomyces sp. NPDC059786 TaxID=3346946 RepID=UPI0036483A0A